jgi:hypothetical protein
MMSNMLIVGVLAIAGLQGVASEVQSHSPWVGLWQGELDGQPGVIVTLGDDAGELSGSVVFNVIVKKEGKVYIAGSDAHVLSHVLLNGDTLTFQVIRHSDSKELQITMHLTGDGQAQLQCVTCGKDSPIAAMVRSR